MFPKYSVIEQLQQKYNSFNPEDFYIISVQHLLESTGSMFEAFIKIGFKPENIFLTGKLYSTNEKTKNKLILLGINVFESSVSIDLGSYSDCLKADVAKMWKQLIPKIEPQNKIIVLDEGRIAGMGTHRELIKKCDLYKEIAYSQLSKEELENE